MKNRLNLSVLSAIFCVILISFSPKVWSQVTVEFRILSVTSDVDDNDAADDSDPTWYYEITDVPFANFGSGSTTLAETNCPGTTVINDQFFSQNYLCALPTQYDFVWYAYEDDGVATTSDGYTGIQTVNIPSGSITVPQAAWTTLGTYNATGAALNCAAGATTTWTVVLQYRTSGALDAIAPTVTSCPTNVNVNTDAGVCTATLDPTDPVFADNCAVTQVTWNMTGATVASSPGTGLNFVGNTVFNPGVTTITYDAQDAQGNSNNSCSFTVTVTDNENPTVTSCPSNVSVNTDAGVCTATLDPTDPVFADNCAVTQVTWAMTGATIATSAGVGLNFVGNTAFNEGVTTITYTAQDAQGNSNASCSFTVTVTDNENPTITCPGNVAQNVDAAQCNAVVNGIAPTATGDNCGVSVQTWALTGATTGNSPPTGINDASGQTFNVGVTTVTYTVEDAQGNSTNCNFSVTITDNENPAIACPANTSVNNDPGLCTKTITYATPVGTDNCPGSVTSLTAGLASGSAFPVGVTVVTYEVTDASGNTDQCSFNVTVNDNQNPTISCPANIAQNNDAGVCGAVVNYVAPVGTDNCPGAVTALTAGFASGATFPIGLTVVTYEVTDASGNTAQCSFNVTITDNENPTISCPADITVGNDPGVCGATVNYVTPVGADNCPAPVTSLTAGQASGTVFPIGTTTVTYQVTDASGNTAQCSFDVTVNDTENPTINCPADITTGNILNVCGSTVNYVAPVGADNCPGSVTTMTAGLVSGAFFPVGTTVVTYEVTDASSNTAQCSFNVTVNDTQNPSITCPANITVSNDVGSCGAIVNYATPTGTDNCPGPVTAMIAGQASGTFFAIGTTTVTYEVTDASGNTSQCSFDVTVNDTEDPTISCPANITVSNDAGLCGAVINYVTPVGADNCPGSVTAMIAGQASGTVFPIGTTTVTYEVTDASGNTAQCSFDVTVNDRQNPTISCPADITVSNDAGVCGATVNYVTPVGADNCPAPVTALIAGQASGTIFPIGTTTVTYEVTDASGNTAQCSFDVTVNDTENPTIACPANITVANDAGVCGATINYVTPVGADNCPGSVTAMIAGQASGTVFPIGTTTVTYEVTDASGNTAQCSFDVTVNDTENPTIACPANITVSNDAGVCGATINYVTPVGADNCPGSVTAMIAGQASGTVFPIGTTTVTYEVTDASGNTAQCSFDVTVNDTENPTISCPANITVSNDAGLCGAVINYVTPVGADNCPGSVTALIAGQASGTVFPIGTTTVTYEVTDASGNTAQCSFDVTVNDTENPTISCPADITVSNDAGVCGATVNYVTPVGADNCPAPVTALIAGQASGTIFPIGTTTVTYEVTDASGNTAQCSFDVTVNDTENPTIACPANIIVANDAGVCGATINYVTPVGADNCPGSVTAMTAGQASGTVFPIGTTTVTYEVTDASGNTAQCSFDVTVNDTENPTIACPANINVSNDAGVCGATINYVTPVGADNCPAPVTAMIAGQASGTVFPIGTTTVTYEVTDASGNTAQCSFDVTVNDTENPTIACPANITVSNDAGLCGATVNYVTPVGADNCPGSVTAMIAGQASGSFFATGTTTVTYEVTDASGNTAQCSFDVIVNDTENPTISCPADITVSNDAGVCGATVNYVTPVGADNCPAPVTAMIAGQASGSIFPIGTTTVTYEVTDASGNTAQCSFDVTVNDTENPTIACPANITVANDAGVCGATINYVTPVGADNCPGSVTAMIAGQASGTIFPIGTTTVTYEVTDASGNTAQCSFDVTVNDTENPTIACPANITVSNDAGVCGATINYVTPVGADNCPASVTAMIAGQASGTVFPIGTTTVTYEVTDASGNTAQCSFDVTVNDTENPTISCPANITVSNDAGLCGATVNYVTPVGADNCPGSVTAMIAGQASGSFFATGTTTVTYEVTDASGNTAQCSFDVIVNDTENPTISCPADITVSNDAGVCGATVNYVTPVGADNCPGSVTTMIAGQASGSFFATGTTTVTYEVTDASGNTAQCSFDVIVNDTENPTISCPADITVSNDAGVCGATVNYVTPVGADNCPAPVTAMIAGQASGSIFPIGTTTVTYEVTDASGNTAQCSFDVTVNDTENPTITCPADITVANDASVCGAIVNYVAPVGADNCPASVTVMTTGQVSGTLFPIGTTTVTFEVTDASGNTAQCSFDVTVNDTENPTIACPANITQNNNPGVCGRTVNYGTPVGADNCPGAVTTLIAGQASGTVFPIGTTTVTYEVTDASGNTAQCSFDVTINDNENPTISCPANITVNNDPGLCGAVVNYVAPVGADNCPGSVTAMTAGQASGTVFPVGTTVVTFEVTDASGNTAQCSFNVTVNDTQNPTINCPADIIVSNDAGICGAIVNYIPPVGADNCPGSATALISGLTSGSQFPVGTTTVTYEVTDASGNTAQCSFDVTVDDSENPTIACPANITVSNDAGLCGAVVNYVTPVGTDNCPGSVTTLTAGQASGTFFSVGTTTVTYLVTDASGNTAQCSFDVTVNDTENPTISCPANITQNNNPGVCGRTVVYVTPSGADNCPGAVTTLIAGQASGTVFPIGTTTVTYEVTDASGNTAQCSFDVTINDNENPTISCPANITVNNDPGLCGAVVNYVAPVGADNCPGSVTAMTAGQASGTVFPVGTTVVTFEVTDASGNTAQCSFNVTVNDTQNPTINCPADIIVSNDAGVCGATVNYAPPVGTDNCPGAVTTLISGLATGSVFPVGTTTVTYEVTDASSNTAQCSFDVTVDDSENPTITCPANITVNNDPALCGAVVNYVAPVGADNCPGSVTTMTAGQASGTVFPIGTTTVTYQVTDASGNTAQCSFDVTVNDTENPTIACPANITLANNPGVCGRTVNYATPVGADNCPGAVTTLIAGQASGTVFPIGTTTVTYQVTDASGNTAQCSFDVTINDTENPTISCPANIVVSNDPALCGAVVNYVTPVGTDNCPGAATALIAGQASGTVFPIGITIVTYEVTDASGNTAQCSFTVTVNDTQNPTINCPADIIVSNDPGSCGAIVNYIPPVGTDNCPGPVTVMLSGQASGTLFPIGTTTVTYQVTDASGNTAQCSFDVTVDDTENPTIACPANITVNNDPGLCGATIVYATPVGADNCPGAVTTLIAGQVSGTVFPIGTTTVTYEVTDASGNTAQCSFDVTVNDTQNPTIACQANITTNNDPGLCGATVNYVVPVGVDNCPGAVTNQISGQPSGTFFPIGTTTITYQVTDASGNTAQCSFDIVVIDNESPTISCPANINVNNDPALCGAVINYVTPVGSDNCPGSVTAMIAGQATGTVFPIGTTTVTYEVTDASGNTAQCSFDVTVTDNENPAITCPADITLSNDGGVCGAIVNYTTPVGTDNCPGSVTTLIAGQASGTLFPIGTTVVTYEVTDPSGNTAQCSFNVTINDTENPIIVCPADIVVNNDPALCGAVINYVTPVGTDNCPGSVTAMIAGQASGTVFPIGTTVVTYEVTDASGNTSQCSFNVTVNDNEAPTIVCPADIIVSNDPGVCGAVVNYVAPVGSDNCPGSVTAMIAGQASGTLFPIGTTVVTFEVTDASGNTAQCSFNVTVNDTELPTISCPTDITVSNIPNVCGATVNYVAPVGADNCPGAVTVMTSGFVSGALFPVGTTVVTFQVTDASGNTAQCSFNVTVNDTQNPTITCPGNINVSNDPGLCGATVNFVPPTGADNCPGSITTLIAGLPPGSFFPIGTTTQTYEVTDASGNTAQCSFDITVADNEAPVIVCPANITVSNDPGVCGAIVNYLTPNGIDNCPGSSTVMIAGLASGSQFPIGTTTVTYEVTDASGNTAQCSFDVTVNDTEAPTISCQPNITVSNDPGVCGASVNYITPVGVDNCPGSITTLISGQPSGTFFPVGITTITYEVTDASGNTAQCSFDIEVQDNENPALSCPADITVSNDPGVCGASVTYTVPTGTDNCPGVVTVLIAGQASGTLFPIGTTTITYESTDAAGNTTQCSFDVTVNDTELPIIACPANINVNNDPGVCGASVNYIPPSGADNCPGSSTALIAGLPPGSVFPVGTTIVTYEVTDASGNTAQCSFNVNVTDNELPTNVCPPDTTVYFDGSCQHVLGNYIPLVTSSDNCGVLSVTQSPTPGTILLADQLVTMTITDVNGNVSNCNFNVFVADSTSPTINCPVDQNVFFDGSCQFILPDYTVLALTGDNCGTVTVTQSPIVGTAITDTTTITLTADDGNGNTQICTFEVNPSDNIAPTITCPGNQNVPFNSNCQYVLLDYTTMAFNNDNCGVVTINQSPAAGTIILDTTTITITVFDAAGNSTSCTFDVNPSDQTNPTITCPGNQNVFFDTNCEYTLLDYTGMSVTGDNCGPVFVSQSPVAGTVITVNTTVTLTIVDGAGNVNSCTFDVIPTDPIPPTITCPADQTVSLSSVCDYTMIDFTGLPVTNDNCGVVSITQSIPTGTIIFNTQTVTLTAFDAAGNTDQCTFDVIPIDDTAPTITCPGAQNVSFNNNCQFILLDYTIMTTNADNCGPISLVQSPAPFTAITDTVTVMITATDAAGNATSCTFNVNPSDNTPPVITSCPPDQNEYVDISCKYTLPDYTGLLVGTDNCGTFNVTQSPVAGASISSNTTITLTAEDNSGNTSNCTFDVLLSDTISPTITCPPTNIDVYFDVNCEYIIVPFDSLTSSYDNCGTTIISQSPAVGTAIFGNQTMTMIVTDASGNTGQCTFNIIPQDTIAPVIGCPGNQVEYLNDTCHAVIPDYTPLANTTANCEAVIVTQSPVAGTVISGQTTVLLFGEDASGNVSFCTFNVTLTDTTRPVITCPPDIQTCDNIVTFSPPTATDNCGPVTVTRITGLPSGSTFPDGITTQTYVAEDAYGNTDTCAFTINVFVKPDGVPLVTNISCYGEVDGSVDLTVNAGNPPFTFDWSNFATSEDLTGLAEGSYTCVITDDEGCQDTVVVDIVEPDSLYIDEVVTDISCYGEVDGNVFVTVNGGTFPYSYNWTPTGAGNSAQNLSAGVYTLTVVDGRGCVVTESYTIVEPDSITINADVSLYATGYQISVEGGSDGWVELDVSGGNSPYTYLWDSGEMDDMITDKPAGTYTVIVTDDNGCIQEEVYILEEPLAPVLYTGFSPNGDGFNDYFQIKNIDRYPNNKLTVMNRWGDVVYEQSAYNNDWDGTPNKGIVMYGDKVPEGSYYYVFELVEGTQERVTGYIVIKR